MAIARSTHNVARRAWYTERRILEFCFFGSRSPERLALQTHPPFLPFLPYSYLSAIIGSTCDARSAGMKPAPSATSVNATADAASTIGSQPLS